MRETVIRKTLETKIVAIVRGMEEEKILPLAEALHKGGIGMMEVTFNQSSPGSFPVTARAIASIAKRFAGDMLAGAGTVTTPELVTMAADAGALYIISPDVSPDVIRKTRELGLVSMPGAFTATEAQTAHKAGADFVKLFPAGNFGPEYLKALRAPLSHIRFLAVGGITDKNLTPFLDAGAVGFGIGGNLVNKAWIDAGEFDKVTALAETYVRIVSGEK